MAYEGGGKISGPPVNKYPQGSAEAHQVQVINTLKVRSAQINKKPSAKKNIGQIKNATPLASSFLARSDTGSVK
jgi:hypothetical protein